MSVKVRSGSLNPRSTEKTEQLTVYWHLAVPEIPMTGMGSCLRGRPRDAARLSDIIGMAAPASSRAWASTVLPPQSKATIAEYSEAAPREEAAGWLTIIGAGWLTIIGAGWVVLVVGASLSRCSKEWWRPLQVLHENLLGHDLQPCPSDRQLRHTLRSLTILFRLSTSYPVKDAHLDRVWDSPHTGQCSAVLLGGGSLVGTGLERSCPGGGGLAGRADGVCR